MYLDYSNITFDSYDRADTPDLLLQTMGGTTIGILTNVFDMKLNVKYSEPSELSFSIAAYNEGVKTPHYDSITGFKIIYTKQYGVYMILEPEITGDGIEEMKKVTAYSIEKELEFRRFFIEEGTFNFWNPVTPENTLLGRILEIADGWSVGTVSPTLIGRYRTFDDYNDYLLSFMYNTLPEKVRCVFVFDPYRKTINAYDVDEEREPIPLYLDFDTIMQQLDVTELSNELVTAIQPYGADDLDIRSVNPIGTNWIYDLSWFIANGDIPTALAEKWTEWQATVLSTQEYYRGLVSMRASATARLLSEQAALKDLEGELESIHIQQNVTIQTAASETTEAGKRYQEQVLETLHDAEVAKKAEIADKEDIIEDLEESLNDEEHGYNAEIKEITDELKLDSYFTSSELAILKKFFIEQVLEEETFVATDVDTTVSGSISELDVCQVSITNSKIYKVDFGDEYFRDIYTIEGGSFAVAGDESMYGDVIRGTLEAQTSGEFLMSLYIGESTIDNSPVPSGLITIHGDTSTITSNVQTVVTGEVETEEGTSVSVSSTDVTFYITANINEYQKYSVKMELFDYAVEVLSDKATPTYEFDVDSANFIFTQELAPFRNELELGKPIYLKLHNGEIIKPILIEFEVDFEERNVIDLVFSNRFKRPDNVNTLKDMIEKSYSSSHSFDASKYIYGKSVDQASQVSQFMSGSLDAAVNTILGAQNQSVVIDGAGVRIGGNSNYQLRIVDSMIAMSDDGWQSAKLAIGHFYSSEVGDYFGVNADIIGGKLLVGNNLVIESTSDGSVVKQFRFDSTGAWMNNATLTLQKSNGGKIIIDPEYGILAGNGNLYTTSGTTVTPSFIDNNGDMTFDSSGFPTNSNFFLDLTDGSAYFRGKVVASSGTIGGWNLDANKLYGGSGTTYVALNSSGSNSTSSYAFWAGAENAASAPFWIKRNGDFKATTGTFMGVVQASDFKDENGNSMLTSDGKFDSDYLELYGITVKDANNNTVMTIDSNGVSIVSGSISWSDVTDTSSLTQSITNAQNTANSASTAAGNAATAASNAATAAANAQSAADDAADDVYDLARGTYTGAGTTFINRTTIYSPEISAGNFYGAKYYANSGGAYFDIGTGGYGDFKIHSSGGNISFEVKDMGGYIDVSSYGNTILVYNDASQATAPQGTWNFSGATVTGLTARFG